MLGLARFQTNTVTTANHILKPTKYKTWAVSKPSVPLQKIPIEVMDVSCRSSLCTNVANDGISSGNRGAGPAESGKTVAGRPGQLGRSRQQHASGAALQSPAVVDFHERGGDQRQSAAAGNSSEHRQYRRVRHEADARNADQSGSGLICISSVCFITNTPILAMF